MNGTRTREVEAQGAARPVAALAVTLAVATATLGGCTWDPHAAQRSSSSSGAPDSTGPSASSVSHEVSPSPSTAETGDTSSSGPSASPSHAGSASNPASSSDPADPFGTASQGPRPAPDPDVAGAFDPDLPASTGAGTGEEVGTLADLSLGSQDGFDRVVLELEGPDVPAWEVRYVPRALGDPTGERVRVDGDAVLQVLLQPVADPDGRSAAYAGPRRVSRSGTSAVAQVVVSTFFDGELQAFVGVRDERRPFRVYGMTDPARIVIEVEHR